MTLKPLYDIGIWVSEGTITPTRDLHHKDNLYTGKKIGVGNDL